VRGEFAGNVVATALGGSAPGGSAPRASGALVVFVGRRLRRLPPLVVRLVTGMLAYAHLRHHLQTS